MHKVCLAGDGWGAIAAFNSLKNMISQLSVVTNDDDLISLLRSQDVRLNSFENFSFDLIICAGYKPLIKKTVVEQHKIINIHYSLLPKYRGMHSTVWALLNGEDQFGLTIHEMNKNMDDGDIITQYKFDYQDQNAHEIMENCNKYIEENLYRVVNNYLLNNIKTKQQNKDDATWCTKRNIDDCRIDFNWDVEFLTRFFKALVPPYPLPRISFKNNEYEVYRATFKRADYIMTNGRVVNIDDDGIWIKISDGYLIIQKLLNSQGEDVKLNELFNIGARLK